MYVIALRTQSSVTDSTALLRPLRLWICCAYSFPPIVSPRYVAVGDDHGAVYYLGSNYMEVGDGKAEVVTWNNPGQVLDSNGQPKWVPNDRWTDVPKVTVRRSTESHYGGGSAADALSRYEHFCSTDILPAAMPSMGREDDPTTAEGKPLPAQWVSFDFGPARKVLPSRYSIRHGKSRAEGFMRSWRIDASADGIR